MEVGRQPRNGAKQRRKPRKGGYGFRVKVFDPNADMAETAGLALLWLRGELGLTSTTDSESYCK